MTHQGIDFMGPLKVSFKSRLINPVVDGQQLTRDFCLNMCTTPWNRLIFFSTSHRYSIEIWRIHGGQVVFKVIVPSP